MRNFTNIFRILWLDRAFTDDLIEPGVFAWRSRGRLAERCISATQSPSRAN
jgi:hypothetical protein